MTGQTFVARAWGYTYVWEIVSGVQFDVQGRAFLWARPARRIGGKRGWLRALVPWYLNLLPNEREGAAL